MRAKKLFLFAPERMALSMERLAHYCGTPAESFQRYVLFTNYAMHVEEFRARFPDAEGPDRPTCRCPPGTTARPTRPASRSSTSASARRTPRPSPTTSPCCDPTRC